MSEAQALRVTVLEACRSPEIPKRTEALALAEFFEHAGIYYRLYSNDHIWPSPSALNKDVIQEAIEEPGSNIIHLAMHGHADKLVLQWSQESDFRLRRPVICLQERDILGMTGWEGKRILSGACGSARLAEAFLAAGAACVIAPTKVIPWSALGAFFSLVYGNLANESGEATALAVAKEQYPEYSSYQLYAKVR